MATKNSVSDVQVMLGEWFDKLPALPANVKDVLVKIAPWISLIFGILGVVLGLLALVGSTLLTPLLAMGGMHTLTTGFLGLILGIVSSALLLASYPGLKSHTMKGWNMLFWSEAVSALGAILSLSLGGVIGAVIGFYILYQIKSYYK